MNLARKGILAIRVKARAFNGLQSVSREVEVRKIVRMSLITPGYRDAATGKLMELDVSLRAIMDPHHKPRPLDPGGEAARADPSRYMLDISPFDQLRAVRRDA